MRVKTSGSRAMGETLLPVAVCIAAIIRPRGPRLVAIEYKLLKSVGHPPGSLGYCGLMCWSRSRQIAGVKAEENVTQGGRGPASPQPSHIQQASAPDGI